MSIHEECGVFGVISPEPTDAAGLCYYGLYALQHRGQKQIGADTLGYLPVSELGSLTGNGGFCGACFTGTSPTLIPSDTRKDRFEQKLSKIGKEGAEEHGV